MKSVLHSLGTSKFAYQLTIRLQLLGDEVGDLMPQTIYHNRNNRNWPWSPVALGHSNPGKKDEITVAISLLQFARCFHTLGLEVENRHFSPLYPDCRVTHLAEECPVMSM